MKPVFAIIISYQRLEMLKKTIESLSPTLPEGSMIAIHDNHSNEDVRTYLKELTETWNNKKVRVRVVLHGENMGWGRAMNYTLSSGFFREWKDFEYVLESNNDVTYEPDWCAKAQMMLDMNPDIGILGLWKHPHHGEIDRRSNEMFKVVIKDNMPATAWFFRSRILGEVLPYPERGPCNTRGGNGEDSEFVEKVKARGYLVAGPEPDLAHHMDGYDDNLGRANSAYL